MEQDREAGDPEQAEALGVPDGARAEDLD